MVEDFLKSGSQLWCWHQVLCIERWDDTRIELISTWFLLHCHECSVPSVQIHLTWKIFFLQHWQCHITIIVDQALVINHLYSFIIDIYSGDLLKGRIKLCKNRQDHRALDIHLSMKLLSYQSTVTEITTQLEQKFMLSWIKHCDRQ